MLVSPNFLFKPTAKISEQKRLVKDLFVVLLEPFFNMIRNNFDQDDSEAFVDAIRIYLKLNFESELFGGQDEVSKSIRILFDDQWLWFRTEATLHLMNCEDTQFRLRDIDNQLRGASSEENRWPRPEWDWKNRYDGFRPNRWKMSQFVLSFDPEAFSRFLAEDLRILILLEAGGVVELSSWTCISGQSTYFPICSACGKTYPAGIRNTKKNVCHKDCNNLLQRQERSAEKAKSNTYMRNWRANHK